MTLPFLRGEADVVAQRGDTPVARDAFLAGIAAIAAALPSRPYVVNWCEDRVRFAQVLAAAMLRGQITLLPPDHHPETPAKLEASYPGLYVLTDGDLDPTLDRLRSSAAVPGFAADQVAAVLFTSGSTGAPQPAVRRWGRLVAGSIAAGDALAAARHRGRVLVATVPHAHSYGLESAVMLPLQHGLRLDATRPFFPADVQAALARVPGSVLVTTPAHLRALAPELMPRAGFVLSATAPLAEDLAARAEETFATEVFEIYGCSEAGQLAQRRTVAGPGWHCLDGFALRHEGETTWASGPHEPDVALADRIAPLPDGGFLLEGRAADQVNVAGKRNSLAWLTAQLAAVAGVADAAFVAPAGADRLAAVAVAPGLQPADIIAALRPRIDPVFLPRPLVLTDALPRDELGKLSHTRLHAMVGHLFGVSFPAGHPAFAGHFPGNPVLPGAALLDAILPGLGTGRRIEAAKFHHPVRPGDAIEVTLRDRAFEARLAGSGELVVTGRASPSPPR